MMLAVKSKTIIVPRLTARSFLNIAKCNVNKQGTHQESLGILLGFETANECIATELIFPAQRGTSGKVDDLGMCGTDTLQWALSQSSTAKSYGQNFRILAWIHSHVEGALCGLSSVDVHTQYLYGLTFPYKVLACVFEVRKDGTHCVDWFDLTVEGRAGVALCCKTGNHSHHQHESCSHRSFFESQSHLIIEKDLPLDIVDGRFTSPLQDFEDKDTKGLVIQKLKPELQTDVCQECQKQVSDLKGLVAHVARAKKCKAGYGDEYNKLREMQSKASRHRSYEKNKSSISKKKQEKYKSMSEKENELMVQKRKTYNEQNSRVIKKRQAVYNENNSNEIAAKQTKYNKKNATEIAKRQAIYDRKHAAQKRLYNKDNADAITHKKKVSRLSKKMPLRDFFQGVATGPIFPCICCHRLMFPSGVIKVNAADLRKEIGISLYSSSIAFTKSFFVNGSTFLCKNCNLLLKKRQRPSISACNGLFLDPVPTELCLTELEQQLIAKRLLFMKIFKLPRSRMLAIKDKVINVPLEDEDITKTVDTLPRNVGNAGLLHVQLKRMRKLKNNHLEAFIRPDAVRIALRKLKELDNPHYKNIKENESCLVNETAESASDSDSTEDDGVNEAEEGENNFNSKTCLVHESPESLVAINATTSTVKRRSQLSSKTFEVAPGEGKIPTNWLREEDFDVMAFPIHFPSGRFGCDYEKRDTKLSKQKYFNQRLLNKDERFRKDSSYLFASQQRIEREQLEQQFDIVVQRGQVRKGLSGETILSTTDSFAAFQKIPGTPKYWQTARNEILAKVAQLGPFQLFFTLSCGEMRWPEIPAALLQLQGCDIVVKYNEETEESDFSINNETLDEYLSKHQINCQKLLRDNILIVTRMFDNRVKKFVSHLVMSTKGPLQVEYYNYRIEFQMRGMAHVHGVMWLAAEFMSQFMTPDLKEYDLKKLPGLIDTMISCERPQEDEKLCRIVEEVQKHNHSKSCHKYGDSCRFNFPRLPSDETIIATPLSTDMPEKERTMKLREMKSVLQKVKNILEAADLKETMTLEELLQEADASYEKYKEALRTSERGTTIILKRTVRERYINNYNPVYLKAWNANMDIQFCHDHYAVITYICDYYGKDDTGMTGLLKQALKEGKGGNQKEKLHCLKNAYLTHREIGACEAVYRLLPNLHLKDSNVTCNFVSTGFPENRSIFMKKVSEKVEEEENEGIPLAGKEGTYEKSVTIHDRYSNRPVALESITLAEFATYYKCTRHRQKKLTFYENSSLEKAEIRTYGSSHEYPIQILFNSSNLGIMQLRNFPSVLRIHESKKKKEEHEYCYAELLLFCPWRDEIKELHRYSPEACLKTFRDNFDLICLKRKQVFPFTDAVEQAQQRLEEVSAENLRSSHIAELLDSEGQQERSNEEVAVECQEPSLMHPGDFENYFDSQLLKESGLPAKFKTINIDNEEEIYSLARQLIPEQQIVFHEVVSFCKETVLSWETAHQPPKAKRIILHGGAGTGKSNVIRAISKWGEKILRKAGDHPQKPRILLTAPTGMAASIIGGTTLHSAFNFNYGDDLKPLSDKKMDEMRTMLSDLKLLIVDEMSMVRSDMLYQLHVRLCDIFQNNELFGGISILLVGDLLQLKPVKGSYIFQEPRSAKYKPFHHITPLWDEFDIYTLSHNHRQGDGNKWAEALNRLRVGDTSKDEAMLSALTISQEEARQKTTACHIFYTNNEVDNHNNLMLNKISEPLTSMPAVVSLPFGCKSSDQFGRVDKTTFMRVLDVKKGARVMMIHNVDIVDGLCNGAMGTVADIVKSDSGHIRCIMIEFDTKDVGVSQREKHPELAKPYEPKIATPIFRTDFQYQLPRGKGNVQHSATARLLQFPLRLAWAVTAHKIQGQTFRKGSHIVVHWHPRLTEGMAYVMLGRCQEPKDISITGPFNIKGIKCSEAAKEMSTILSSRALSLPINCWKYPQSIKISLINSRSFKRHQQDIQNDHLMQKADIICITETWLEPQEENRLVLRYHPFVSTASKGRGRGCAILSKSGLSFQQVVTEDVQVLSASMQYLQIILVYRSQENDFNNLVEILKKNLKPDTRKILLGDFNASPDENKIWREFTTSMKFYQKINLPTHEKGGTLDHVYVQDIFTDKVSHFQHQVYFSDHVCINIEVFMN